MAIKPQLFQRISVDPEVYHGKPCIKTTRIPVHIILELLQYGLSFQEIMEEYPQIAKEDIQGCIEYAIKLIDTEV